MHQIGIGINVMIVPKTFAAARCTAFVLVLYLFISVNSFTPSLSEKSIETPQKRGLLPTNSPSTKAPSTTLKRLNAWKPFSRAGLTVRSSNLKALTDDDQPTQSFRQKHWLWLLVLPLWSVFLSYQWSRYLIGFLVDFSPKAEGFRAMNVAIGFDKNQYSMLASLAFTALYTFASLGAGAMADILDRKVLTIVAATGWSIATLGTSLSTTYGEMVLWRLVMGLTCAFAAPTAYTFINQNVPKNRVSLASSIYGTGVVFGGSFASLSILLNNRVGWRATTQIVAAFGFITTAIAALVVRDERSKETPAEPATASSAIKPSSTTTEHPVVQFGRNLKQVVSFSRVRWILAAALFRFSAGMCIGVWSPPYFRLAFPEKVANYAVAQALITAIAGSLSGIVGGVIADALSRRSKTDPTGRRLWVPLVGSCLAAPAWYLAVHTKNNFPLAMALLTFEYLVGECWFGPTISALQTTVGRKIGGTAQGCFSLGAAFANFAPALLGYFYSRASSVNSSQVLANLLASSVGIFYMLSAFCFSMAARTKCKPSEELNTNMTS